MNADFQIPITARRLGSVRAFLAFYLIGAMSVTTNPSNATDPKE
jgi:hypothetical protein